MDETVATVRTALKVRGRALPGNGNNGLRHESLTHAFARAEGGHSSYAVPTGGARVLKERLSDISRLVSDWIWETDADLRLKLTSDRAWEVVGLHPLQLRDTSLLSLVTDDDSDFRSTTRLATFLAQKRNFRDVAVKVHHADGRSRSLLLSGVAMFENSDGRFVGYRGTARDVTSEREADAALRRQHAIMQAVGATAELLLATIDWRRALPKITERLATAAEADGIAIVAAGDSKSEGGKDEFLAALGSLAEPIASTCAQAHQRCVPETVIDAAGHRVTIPVLAGATWWGSLIVDRGSSRPPLAGSEIEALKAAAGLIGTAIHRCQCERQSSESSALAATVFATSPDPVLVLRVADGMVMDVNEAFERLTAHLRSDVIGRSLADLRLFTAPADVRRLGRALFRHGALSDEEFRFRTRDGDVRVGSVSAHLLDRSGDQCLLAVVRDVTERRRATETIHTLSAAVEQSPALVMIADPQGVIEYVNPQFSTTTGHAGDALIGRTLDAIASDDPAFAAFAEAVATAASWHGEVRIKGRDGRSIAVDQRVSTLRRADGSISHVVMAGEDVTKRREAEACLEHSSRHDALTNLPNRGRFFELVEECIARKDRKHRSGLLLLIDIDRFSQVNDSLGPDAGDIVLRTLAERLTSWAGPNALVARLASDEFAVFIPTGDRKRCDDAAEHVLSLLRRPMPVGEEELIIHVSAGVASFPQDGDRIAALLKCADNALVGAKGCGGNTWQCFRPSMQEKAKDTVRLGQDLRYALDREELVLYFQPVLALDHGPEQRSPKLRNQDRIIGAEALIRWQHPKLGLVSPAEFVGIAEDQGLIEAIGEWALRVACQEAKRWEAEGLGSLHVAVNVSSLQLQRGRVLASVFSALSNAGLSPQRLCLEITESAVLADVDEAKETLERLRTTGIVLSLDDFGTGYASLSYLRRLPFGVVKIDRSFVRNLASDAGDQAIVDAIIAMAHRLGLKVVAEGIDDHAPLARLRAHGCEMVQGFLFSQPLPPDEFVSFVRDHQQRCSASRPARNLLRAHAAT